MENNNDDVKEKEEQPVEAVTDKLMNMHWVHPVHEDTNSLPRVYGYQLGKKLADGTFVVPVLSSRVKSEISRAGKRLLTAREYKKYIKDSQ